MEARVTAAVNRALFGQADNPGGRGRSLAGVMRTLPYGRGPVRLWNPEQLRRAAWAFLRHLVGDMRPSADGPIASLDALACHLRIAESDLPEPLARAFKAAPACAASEGWEPSRWAVWRVADAALGNLNRAGEPTGAVRKALDRSEEGPTLDPWGPVWAHLRFALRGSRGGYVESEPSWGAEVHFSERRAVPRLVVDLNALERRRDGDQSD